METLKPCPFCGYLAVLGQKVSDGLYFITCTKVGNYKNPTCSASIDGFSNKENLIKAWNTRVNETDWINEPC